MFILKAFSQSSSTSDSSLPDGKHTQDQSLSAKNRSEEFEISSDTKKINKNNVKIDDPNDKENRYNSEDNQGKQQDERIQRDQRNEQNLLENEEQGEFTLLEPKQHKNNREQDLNISQTQETYVVYSIKDWVQVTKSKSRQNTSYSELKTSLRAGIPASMRPRIWMWLAGVPQLQSQYEKGIFERLAGAVNNRWESEIKKDLHRTMGDSPFFQGPDSLGQKQLFRVINAFCNIDSSGTGYAQGTNMIVAIILLTLHDQRNFKNPKRSFGVAEVTSQMIEEWAFWIFFFIMHEKNHFKIYQQNMVKRYQLLDALQNRIKEHSPRVLTLLQQQEVELGTVFDHELFSILASKSPLPLVQLTMDMFLLDGHTALIDIMSRIIQLNEQKILSISEFDELLYFLKNQKNHVTWERYHKAPYMLIPFECIILPSSSQISSKIKQ